MQYVRVRYGERLLNCRVVHVATHAKRIRLHVQHDGRIEVDVPPDMTRQDVKRAIGKRARWLWRQVDDARARHDGLNPRRYVSGETHFYLGRRYLLKRLPATDEAPLVKAPRGRMSFLISLAGYIVGSLMTKAHSAEHLRLYFGSTLLINQLKEP